MCSQQTQIYRCALHIVSDGLFPNVLALRRLPAKAVGNVWGRLRVECQNTFDDLRAYGFDLLRREHPDVRQDLARADLGAEVFDGCVREQAELVCGGSDEVGFADLRVVAVALTALRSSRLRMAIASSPFSTKATTI